MRKVWPGRDAEASSGWRVEGDAWRPLTRTIGRLETGMRLGVAGWMGVWLVAGILIPEGSWAGETVVLRADADTTLFFAAPGANLGASDSMAIGSTGHDQPGRGLIRFPLAGTLPSGAVVTSARLEFQVTRAPAGGVASLFRAHRLLRPWVEGRGTGNLGSPAVAGEVTWERRSHPDESWGGAGAEPGLDYVAGASGEVRVDGLARYGLEGPTLVRDVQAWLEDPASNAGWILISDGEGQALTARRVGTREAGEAVATLTLGYEVGTPRPVLTRWGRVGDRFEFEFRGEPGNVYEVQFRDRLGDTASWGVLTNIVVKLVPANPVISEPLAAAAARYYRVADVGDVD